MTRAERADLEHALEHARRALFEARAEHEGFSRAAEWADVAGEPTYDRAATLAIEAEVNVAYYEGKVEQLEDELGDPDTDADHRAFERDAGARR